MFDWITKPYIQWNFIDSLICSVGLMIAFVVIPIIVSTVIKKRKEKKVKNNGKRNIR